MPGLTIHIEDAGLREDLARFQHSISDASVKRVAGRSAVNRIKSHLRGLEQSRPNRLGGRRTHFWSNSADATNFQPVADGVEVSINQEGFAQRYFGGPIRPVNKRKLAIPFAARAHGRLPSDFGELQLVYGRRGPYALAEPGPSNTARSRILFLLADEVRQDPDHSVLPTDSDLHDSVLSDISSYIDRALSRSRPEAAPPS
jgi:hypothetical protein